MGKPRRARVPIGRDPRDEARDLYRMLTSGNWSLESSRDLIAIPSHNGHLSWRNGQMNKNWYSFCRSSVCFLLTWLLTWAANTLVYAKGKGIVVNEPSVVAIQISDDLLFVHVPE